MSTIQLYIVQRFDNRLCYVMFLVLTLNIKDNILNIAYYEDVNEDF